MSLLCSKSLLSLSKSLKWSKYLPWPEVPHHLQGTPSHGFHLSWLLPQWSQSPLSESVLGNVLLWVSWLVLPYPFRCVSSYFPSRFFLITLLTIINSLPPHHSHFLSFSPLCVYSEYWMSLSHIWYILTSLFICLFYFSHPALPLNISSKQARIFWFFFNAWCPLPRSWGVSQ